MNRDDVNVGFLVCCGEVGGKCFSAINVVSGGASLRLSHLVGGGEELTLKRSKESEKERRVSKRRDALVCHGGHRQRLIAPSPKGLGCQHIAKRGANRP